MDGLEVEKEGSPGVFDTERQAFNEDGLAHMIDIDVVQLVFLLDLF